MVALTSYTGITNFTGNYAGSVKEPDLSFFPSGPGGLPRDFPSIILESVWPSTEPGLPNSHRIWHEGSGGRVKVVILVKLYKPNEENKVRATLEISRTVPPGTMATTHQVPFLPPTLGSWGYYLPK